MRSMCAVGVSLRLVRGTEGMRWLGMGEEGGEIVWDEEKVDEDDQEEYHQTQLTAKHWNARRLLQVKIH